jgi:transposase
MNQVRIVERKAHDALKDHKYTFLRNRENLSDKKEKALAEIPKDRKFNRIDQSIPT